MSDIPMKLQIVSLFFSTFLMVVAVDYLHWGVLGTAVATSISNGMLMLAILYESGKKESIAIAKEVTWRDPQVLRQISLYLTYAVPNIFCIMIDWFCFQAMAIVSGFFGVQQQAVQVLLFNFQVIMFQIPFGFKCGICTLVGKQVGSGDMDEAIRVKNILLNFCLFFDLTEFAILFAVRHYIIMIFT